MSEEIREFDKWIEQKKLNKCNKSTEVYSRVCGYHRPISNWNRGKQQEFQDRLNYSKLNGKPKKKAGE